jgi:hypothetical protein
VRQAEPAQRRPDRRQRAGLNAALDQLVPDLGQRDARPDRRELAQQVLLAGKQRLAVAAALRRLRAAGRARPRRPSLIAADALTSNRAAAARAELPCSTARTSRLRRSWDKGAVITASLLNRQPSNQNR